MRVNLNVPFVRKDEAKHAGAKWDPKRRVWFVFDQDLSEWQKAALAQFVPSRGPKIGERKSHKAGHTIAATIHGVIPDCGCTDVAPWEDCRHTDPALYADIDAVKAIAGTI